MTLFAIDIWIAAYKTKTKQASEDNLRYSALIGLGVKRFVVFLHTPQFILSHS